LAGASDSPANDTRAQTGSAQTGSDTSNDTRAQTGFGYPESAQPLPESASRCEPFRQVILDKLEQGLTAKRIHQDLIEEHGFADKYWSVYRFVDKLGLQSELPFRRIEVEPGAEMQVDFGSGAKVVASNGKVRKTHVFRAVLSYSRKGYSEAVFKLTTENFIRVLENAFWRLGGVPKVIVFDNAKCAVNQADWYDPELNPKIVEFCKHYGCAFIPTRPRTPRHKGKVERGVDYVQENGLRAKSFESLAAQNEHLDHWEETIADTRIHGTTKQQVRKLFESAEKGALLPLPSDHFPFYREARRKVSRDGHIAVERAYYSVPPEYLGCEVWVRYDSRLVRILNSRMQCIATHCVKEPGRFSTLDCHLAAEKISGVERGLEYLLRKVRFLGPHATRWAEQVIEQRGVEASRVLQGLLSLSRKHSSESINDACDVAWRSGALNYRVIKRLLQDRAAASQTMMEFMETHPIIRPVSEYSEFIHQSLQGG
jgi:transposase